MYKDRNYNKDEYNEEFVYEYVKKMRLEDKEKYLPDINRNDYISLKEIILQVQNLKYIYDNSLMSSERKLIIPRVDFSD